MKLAMVGIVVADMAAAQTFYQHLGFNLDKDSSDDYAELVNEGVRISLNTTTMITSVYGFPPAVTGERIELAFSLETPAAVDEKVAAMKAYGYRIVKEPWDAFWGQRYALIADVDGNLLSLFAALPEK